MAKKIRRGNRVQRFRDWSPEHKAAVLDKLGITLEDFRSYGGDKKERVLNRAFDGQKPSGGGSHPSQPAFDRNDPAAFTAPLSYNQTLRQGNAAADLVYKPQQQILTQQAVNIPSWFDQYRQSLSAAQTQQQQMAQPMLDQTAARADNAGKPTAGIDPNSQAGQDDVLAAAGRKALIEAGLAALQGTTAATQGYLAGRVGVANTAQQQALTDNTTAQKSLAAERGSYLADYVGKQRENERRNTLENAAFGLDQYKAQADAASAGQKQNKWGYTADEWTSFSPAKRERIIKRQSGYGKSGSKGPSAKDLAMYDVNGNGKLDPGEYVNRPGQGGGKDSFGNTPKQQRAANSEFKKASAVAGQITKPGDTWKDVYQLLVVKYPTGDSDTLKAVAIKSVGGKIGPKLRASLLKRGINPKFLRSAATGQMISRPPNAAYGNGESRPT